MVALEQQQVSLQLFALLLGHKVTALTDDHRGTLETGLGGLPVAVGCLDHRLRQQHLGLDGQL